jgi:hypothetical protein
MTPPEHFSLPARELEDLRRELAPFFAGPPPAPEREPDEPDTPPAPSLREISEELRALQQQAETASSLVEKQLLETNHWIRKRAFLNQRRASGLAELRPLATELYKRLARALSREEAALLENARRELLLRCEENLQQLPAPRADEWSAFLQKTLQAPVEPQDEPHDSAEERDARARLRQQLRETPLSPAPPPRVASRFAPDGWSLCDFDSPAVFARLPGLSLRPGYQFSAYVFRQGNNGNGVVWALPEGVNPAPGSRKLPPVKGQSLFQPPEPQGALRPMSVVDGDRSLRSYVYASLLSRELDEFGALWHGVSWGAHAIVAPLPPEAWVFQSTLHPRWPIRQTPRGPQYDIAPRAERLPQGGVIVLFFSVTREGTVRLVQHADTYPPDSYVARHDRRVVATGGPGYVT